MSEPSTSDVVFLDYGPFAEEGFTSGLMIIIKEILREFSRRGKSSSVLSLSEKPDLSPPGDLSNLSIVSLRALDGRDEGITVARIQAALRRLGAEHVVLHVPSVFLDSTCIAAFRAANSLGASVISVLGDPLFPRRDSDEAMVLDLYHELAQTEVIGVGDDTRRQFSEATGIVTRRLINPFSPETFRLPDEAPQGRLIGMVNIHPLKGRSVFDLVAQRMPEHEFLMVKNWPDAPPYQPGANVLLADFFPDPRELYRQLRVLLVPSLWGEGPARVVAEALSNGIPVIAHEIGSLGEFRDFGVLFVEPPSIDGYELEGTVLYPRIRPQELARAADGFVRHLGAILADDANYRQHSEQARAAGRRYLMQSAASFAEHFDRWLGVRVGEPA